MYKYEMIKNKKNIWNYRKALMRCTLPGVFINIGILDLILSLLWIMEKDFHVKNMLNIIVGFIIFQIIVVIIYFGQIMNKWVKSLHDSTECEVAFDEKGIEIVSNYEKMKFSWEATKKVKVYKNYMIFNFSIRDMPSFIFLFDSFDADKGEIINQIEKYKKVRG